MVEGRYWSCGVGGLGGFRGGWPGRLERPQAGPCGMDGARPGPWAGRLAGQLGRELGQPSPPSASRRSPRGLHPLPCCGPGLLGLHFLRFPSPTSSLSHSSDLHPHFCLGVAPPSSLLPPISVRPALRPPPASHRLDQMGKRQRPTGQPCPATRCPPEPCVQQGGLCPGGRPCRGSRAKAAKAGGGPSPPEEGVSSTINTVCLNTPREGQAGGRSGWHSGSPAQGHLTSRNPPI